MNRNDESFNPFYNSDFLISHEGRDERRLLVELYTDDLVDLRDEIDTVLKIRGEQHKDRSPLQVSDDGSDELWVMNNGRTIRVRDMTDQHVINCYYMLFRHDVVRWIRIFRTEIEKRGLYEKIHE